MRRLGVSILAALLGFVAAQYLAGMIIALIGTMSGFMYDDVVDAIDSTGTIFGLAGLGLAAYWAWTGQRGAIGVPLGIIIALCVTLFIPVPARAVVALLVIAIGGFLGYRLGRTRKMATPFDGAA